MTKKLSIQDEIVISKIYYIREQKVMLDSDLAELYQVETRVLNQQVRRNENRFPKDFMFKLTNEEWETLKSQFATSSWGGRRNEPYAFTEHGVLMLSSVLNSKKAIAVNIQIMRVFTKLRKMLMDNLSLKFEIDEVKKELSSHNKNIELIFNYLDELLDKKKNTKSMQKIGYKK